MHCDAASTFHDDDFREACLPMRCSGCLELTTENVVNSDSVTVFKSRLKTFLFSRVLSSLSSVAHCLAPVPLKLPPYSAIQMFIIITISMALYTTHTCVDCSTHFLLDYEPQLCARMQTAHEFAGAERGLQRCNLQPPPVSRQICRTMRFS